MERMENRLLDHEALAPFLCLSPRTVLNKLCKDPDSLPPAVKVRGFKGPRWRLSDVQCWIDGLPLSEPETLADMPKITRAGRRRRVIT